MQSPDHTETLRSKVEMDKAKLRKDEAKLHADEALAAKARGDENWDSGSHKFRSGLVSPRGAKPGGHNPIGLQRALLIAGCIVLIASVVLMVLTGAEKAPIRERM